MCDFHPASTVSSTHVRENCGPSDRALDVYINEQVQIPRTPIYSLFTQVFSPSKPVFSYTPNELIGEAE